MKKILIILLGLVCSFTNALAHDYKSEFLDVEQQFELRLPTAQEALKNYINTYPYTVYEDEVYTMQAVLYTEKGKYKQATKLFSRVRAENLARHWEPMYYFYSGYAYIQQEDYASALPSLLRVKDKKSHYFERARYYIGYCYYVQEEYDRALVEFLKLEKKDDYKEVVPYFVTQIYYAQGDTEKVKEKAEGLLENYIDNENNLELHRILGEVYYQSKDYNKAEGHLDAYRKLCEENKKEIIRNDLYLLGVSQYMVRNYEGAVASLKNVALQEDTLSESTCLHLGHCYLRLQDLENAKLSYAAAIRYNLSARVREEAMYNYVQVTYLQNSAMGESITAFQDFIKEYPDSKYISKIHALMADLYMSSKNYSEALNALLTISDTDSKLEETKQYLRYQLAVDAFVQADMQTVLHWAREVIKNASGASEYKTEAYYLAAHARYNLQDYQKCIENIDLYNQQANVKRSKNIDKANYLKGYALFNQKQYAAAEPFFSAYADTKPQDATYTDALNRQGDCLFHERKFLQAIAVYIKVAKQKAKDADYALLQNAYAQGLLHLYEKKVEVLKELLKEYPQSDYADDALYEMARAELQQKNNEEAIAAYKELLKSYPTSNRAAKASLEMGMSYRTLKQYDQAIDVFKTTIEKYAGTEEAYAALENLEQLYVENNQIADYISYTKQLSKVNMQTASSEDSLVYVTAELQYMLGRYTQAAAGLTTYLTQFCPGGRYCTNAMYYAARSYYELKQFDNAIEQYSALAETQGNPYMEEACMRAAELYYDKKEYKTARYYFQRMNTVASNNSMRTTALLGVLRCSKKLNDSSQILDAASTLLAMDNITEEVRNEALYMRGKELLETNQYGQAVVDFTPLAKEVRTIWGAEAQYQIAYCYYQLGSLDMAEQEIMSFTQKQTTHQYWLAKSLILLSDINVDRQELFQAKQYLLALQSNYKQQDDITSLLSEKLERIAALEQATAEPSIEEEEELL